ncbi:sensor histidine kinase [Flavobacterium sp.]|uniref:sensor histidine kinase n=1 Tax=Flavobacterium sp. TaxID=239 RepID=UPI004034AAF2
MRTRNLIINLLVALAVALLFTGSAYPQHSASLRAIAENIAEGEYQKAGSSLSKIRTGNFSTPDKAYYHLLLAQCYEGNNQEELAYAEYLASKKLYLSADSIKRAMEINYDLAYLLKAQEKNINDYKRYIDEYAAYYKKSSDPKELAEFYSRMGAFETASGDPEKSLGYFKAAKHYLKIAPNPELRAMMDMNLATLYINDLNKPDSALYHLRKNLDYLTSQKANRKNTTQICYNYVNQAAAFYYLEDYNNAITFLKKADAVPIKDNVLKTKQFIYEFLYKNYEAAGDHANAYNYLLLNKRFSDSAKTEAQNVAINDIQVKYRTKEKELENIKLKDKNKTKTILLYTFTGLLLAGITIGWLIVKNARRREKISRQEKLIEQQKLEKALKNYELQSIDMMLEGQDKERQRIANDLHDNLGSMLATLKINFENLRIRKNELRDEENRLYDKTDELIEEAYQKVRGMAHAKNAGVFANEGLIPAIKKLAEKISVPGKLTIHVAAFGFEDRMENSLEIAVFRMVQELATNIVKHSQATEATIHLTDHDDNINLMIEDNGIGFTTEESSSADGMGLDSIRKKIRQMGGQFTIDSTPGNGATIIIDLPL